MADAIQDRARVLLSSSTQGLQLWALTRLNQLVAVARERLAAQSGRVPEEARGAAQRFGSQLWQRVTARFPGLADLLDDAGTRTSSRTAQPTPAPTPNPTPEPAAVTQGWQRTTRGLAAFAQPAPAYDVPALLLALRDPSAEVAAAAATALGVCNEPSMEPQCHAALLSVLANHDGYFSPLTRVAALQSLVLRLCAPASESELEPLLGAVRDLDAEVSIAAIAAVASHAPPNVVLDRLFPVAFDETGFFLPMVRSAATRALERAGLLTTAR